MHYTAQYTVCCALGFYLANNVRSLTYRHTCSIVTHLQVLLTSLENEKITDLSLALTSRLTASHSGLTLAALGGGSCCFLNYRRRIFEPNILLLSPTDGQCYREKG